MNLDTIVCADALTFLASLPSASVDMVLCDLPYGTTACSWDEIIPFAPMWEQFRRVTKPRAAIVLTASQPFTSKLVMSNLEMFKYEWMWEKSMGTGFQHAKNMPLKAHENVLVFSKGVANHAHISSNRMNYYPQMEIGEPYIKKTVSRNVPKMYNLSPVNYTYIGTTTINLGERYPTSVLPFPNSNHGSIHPTQKPVALFEYLIRTYTQAGDVVLDCCMGSGTTAVAARQCGRHYIGCDSHKPYVKLAQDRLAKPWQPALLEG